MLETYDHEGEPVMVRSIKEVCPRCHGEGTHVNPNVDGHGITTDEMYELGEEFEQDYLSGVYDVVCEECHGRNVVDVADPTDPNYEFWLQDQRDRAEDAAIQRAESGFYL